MTNPPKIAHDAQKERLRSYAILGAITALIIACVVWAWATAASTHRQAEANARVATKLCKQINELGQPCVTPTGDVPSGAAIVPALPASPSFSPLPRAGATATTGSTKRPGVEAGQEGNQGQAYAPGLPAPGAEIVAVTVQAGALVLTYDDGSRVDAGPVDLTRLAIVLHGATESSPSPSPSPVVSVSPSPSPSPTPVLPDDTWEPTEQAPDTVAPTSTEETP